MQTRTSLVNGDLPCCPVDPNHPVHCHGKYARYANCHELIKSKWIPRFLCYPCGHTISVLPEDTLPYRPISVPPLPRLTMISPLVFVNISRCVVPEFPSSTNLAVPVERSVEDHQKQTYPSV